MVDFTELPGIGNSMNVLLLGAGTVASLPEQELETLAPHYGRRGASGALRTPYGDLDIKSGYPIEGGPEDMPDGARGFTGVTRGHLEGRSIAIMHNEGFTETELSINEMYIAKLVCATFPECFLQVQR